MVLMSVLMFLLSCNKESNESMVCKVSGKLMVRGLNVPATFSADNPPLIELYELKYLNTGDIFTPSYPYKVPVAVMSLKPDASYHCEVTLERDGEYFLAVSGYDTGLYITGIDKMVKYTAEQTLHAEVLARSWVIPRFINSKNIPGDTFFYHGGIGGSFMTWPVITVSDTLMPWVFETWGGPPFGEMTHKVKGEIYRQGIKRDTTIQYLVPPADTSIVDILW